MMEKLMDEWLGQWPQTKGCVRLMPLWHSKLPPVNPTVEKWYLTQQWVSEGKATAQKKLAPKKISFIPSSLERHRSVGGAVQCCSLLGAGSGCCRLQEWSRRFISSIFNCRFVIWILLLKENQLIFSLSPLIF